MNISEVDNLNYVFAFQNGDWVLWDNGNYSENNFSRFENLSPQIGYWLNMGYETQLEFSGIPATCPEFSILESGWHLLGSCETDNLDELFAQNENALILYTFDSNIWSAIGNNTEMNDAIQDSEIEIISDLLATQGFWIYIE